MKALRNEKILITGVSGQIAFPIAAYLAGDNEVWGIARFRDEAARKRVEAAGVIARSVDLAEGDFSGLPDDFTYVLHLAVFQQSKPDYDWALKVNAEGTGFLMSRFRKARAFLVMSTCSVYARPADPSRPVREADPLGVAVTPHAPTYSVSKIAQEAVARFAARQWNIPTVIPRMNVSYGPNGGLPAYLFDMMLAGKPVPIEADYPSVCNPIYQEDINAQVARLLAVASVPATIVNWGGDEPVDMRDVCLYMGQIAELEVKFQPVRGFIQHVWIDNTRRRELIGECTVGWREGMRRMIAVRHPEVKLP